MIGYSVHPRSFLIKLGLFVGLLIAVPSARFTSPTSCHCNS
jgi:hypothetical protein